MSTPAISFLTPDDDEELLRRVKAAQPQPGPPAVSFVNQPGTTAYKTTVGATSRPNARDLELKAMNAPEVADPNIRMEAPALSFASGARPLNPNVLAAAGAMKPNLDKLRLEAQERLNPSPNLTANQTPAVSFSGVQAQTAATAPSTPVVSFVGDRSAQPSSGEEEYRELLKHEPTRAQFPAQKMPAWKKILGSLAAVAGGIQNPEASYGLERKLLESPERKAEQQFEQAHNEWEGRASNLARALRFRQQDLQDRNVQSEIDARNNRLKTEKPENLDREAYDYYVGQGMTPAQARQRVLQDAQDVKPERQNRTSPFEAFAYGSPEEKKAAQDFLDMEHRLGSRYRNPTEFEEKYRLYKHDPEAYRAMFGDKAANKPDKNTATRMLNYFDKRRREVNQDFTLDDTQRKEQLDEIEKLERPFMDAVQPNATGGNGDRIEVIHPDGRRGSIPRSQLDAAKKKGYREVSPQ